MVIRRIIWIGEIIWDKIKYHDFACRTIFWLLRRLGLTSAHRWYEESKDGYVVCNLQLVYNIKIDPPSLGDLWRHFSRLERTR